MINTATIMGRFAREHDIRIAGSNQKVLRNTIAVSHKYNGEEKTDWIDVVAFGKIAETLETFTGKGDEITTTGRLQTSTYERKDGTKAKDTTIVISDFSFGRKAGGATQQAPAETYDVNPDDDLPF